MKSEIDGALGRCSRLAAKFKSLEIEDKQDWETALRVFEAWERAYANVPDFVRSEVQIERLEMPLMPVERVSIAPPPEVVAMVRGIGNGGTGWGHLSYASQERERARQMDALEGM